MKTAVKISQAVIYFVALLMILLAFDAFEEGNTILENIIGFLIHSSLGFFLLLLTYILRRKYLIFGILLVSISIFFFFFFHMIESIYSILTIFLPIMISGVIHILYAKQKQTL